MARARALLLILISAATAAAADNPYAEVLKARGIQPTREGITALLKEFVPTPETPRRIASLIETLRGPDAELREQAVRQLERIPFLSGGAVRDASHGGDTEVRRLCKRIITVHRRSEYREVLRAAFQTIRINRLRGLAGIVLAALPYCDEMYLQQPAQGALAATARPSDVPLLRQSLLSQYPSVQVGAVHALGKLIRKGAAPDLLPLLQHKNAHVRLATAEVFAGFGMRECLAPLADLLDASDRHVRWRSGAILRALTGRKLGATSYAAPKHRREAMARWKQFVRERGNSVPLRLPLRVEAEFLARTLVCAINTKRLEEYDRAGKLTFASGPLKTPWGCQGLPNGHRLVAIYVAQAVVEYDDTGKEIWRSDKLPGNPMSVQRLGTGNTLVACGDSGKIVEITPGRHIVWSVTLPGRPVDARRLRNGRTLIALYRGKRIVEVARNGSVKWEIRGAGLPSTVQRLRNGNTLVAELLRNGAVTEYTRAGVVVWKLEGLGRVFEAQRLPGGNTLVATARGIAEYDRAGRVVWRVDLGPCRAMRY